MNYFYDVLTPNNTPITSIITTPIKLTSGTIDYMSIFFPFGCAALVGVQIWHFGYQLFPTNRTAYYLGDNALIQFNTIVDVSEEPYTLYIKSYNLDDLYDHTIYVNVNMTRTIVNNNVVKFIKSLGIGLE